MDQICLVIPILPCISGGAAASSRV